MSEQAANDNNTGGEGIPRRVALSEKDKLRMKRKAKIKRMEKYKSKRVYEFLISMDYSEKQRFFLSSLLSINAKTGIQPIPRWFEKIRAADWLP